MNFRLDKFRDWRSWPLLWKMLAVAIGVHIVIGLLTIPGFLVGGGESLDDQYTRGQDLIKTGRYAEAMDVFQHILDAQPKPQAIFAKAAQQHELAEKLAKQAMETPATTQAAVAMTTTVPATPAAPDQPTVPKELAIPPELRGK